jgi:uncharacterized membrane protein
MKKSVLFLIPVLVVGLWVGWSVAAGNYLSLIAFALASVGFGLLIRSTRESIDHSGLRTMALIADPRLLAERRNEITEELAVLEDAQDLQRSVFEVSAELVGCVDEHDARARFAAAVRRYWAYDHVDLAIWERGSWRVISSAGYVATGR